jgi:hypothetical protein
MRFVHFSCMSTLRSDVVLYKANTDAMQRTSYSSENQQYNMSTSVESQRPRCDVCQKMFASRSNLKRHIKLHRPKEEAAASDGGHIKMKRKLEIRLVRCDEDAAASDTGGVATKDGHEQCKEEAATACDTDVLTVKALALPQTNGDVMLLFLCLVGNPEKKGSSVRLFLHEFSSSEGDGGFTRPFLVLRFDRAEFLEKVLNNCAILPGDLMRARTEKLLHAVDTNECVTRTRAFLATVNEIVGHHPRKTFFMVFNCFVRSSLADFDAIFDELDQDQSCPYGQETISDPLSFAYVHTYTSHRMSQLPVSGY